MTTQTNLRLDDRAREMLWEAVKKTGLSMGTLIEMLVYDHLEDMLKGIPQPPSELVSGGQRER